MTVTNRIHQLLVDRKPEEKGGPIAEERFGYQKEWAICKLLDLHSKQEDYLMIFEYHDDIMVLDSSENPTMVSFYQIKTKSKGQWTLNNLISKKENETNSFLGKLYKHKIKFPEVVSELNFVSNARFNLKLNNSSHKSCDLPTIKCLDLAGSEINTINDNIKDELGITNKISMEDGTFFQVSDIPIINSENSSIAALVNFFESSPMQQLPGKIKPLHATLINEIRRKSKYTLDVNSVDELIQFRSFTRTEFQKILMLAASSNTTDLKATSHNILSRLNNEGESMRRIKEFNTNANKYIIDKLDITNESILALEKDIQKTINKLTNTELDQDLIPCARLILKNFSNINYGRYIFDEPYIYTVILFQLYGNE